MISSPETTHTTLSLGGSLFNAFNKDEIIIKLNKRIEEHKANMEDDFTTIKNYSLNIKKQKILSQWINSTIKITFINFDNKISACSFKNNWIK